MSELFDPPMMLDPDAPLRAARRELADLEGKVREVAGNPDDYAHHPVLANARERVARLEKEKIDRMRGNS